MTIEAYVENGQIVLPSPLSLPNGTKVNVSVSPTRAEGKTGEETPSLYERMESFIGCVDDLPADFALNHDHYLHG